jgi:hypothetical protein
LGTSAARFAKGTTIQRPEQGEVSWTRESNFHQSAVDGMIRYNTDATAGRDQDGNLTYGRLEVYYGGEWTSLISLADMSNGDVSSSTNKNENLTLKVLSDILKDFFATAMGGFYCTLGGLGNAVGVNQSNQLSFLGGQSWSYDLGLNKMTAQAYPIIGNGMLDTITVTAGGNGYTSPPMVRINDITGSGASARAVIQAGSVVSITILDRGFGYTSPTVEFIGDGKNAAATIQMGNGKIVDVKVTKPGNEYGPQITLTGTGTGAFASATIRNGIVTAVNVTANGAGYTAPPTVTFSSRDGQGAGASATAVVANGKVTAINVTNGGAGYTPFVTLTDPNGTGSGCLLEATVDGGGITKITPVNKGQNYSNATTIAIGPDKGNYARAAAGAVAGYTWNFTFDLFDAIGLPNYKRKDYRLSLFTGVNRYSDQLYYSSAMQYALTLRPRWAVGAVDETSQQQYGRYDGTITVFGNDPYHSAHVSLYWYAQTVKFRNF